ncbi:MAG: UDP-N-acetylmuramate dehydrogenase [Clostridia bacterium]|nr:UDP-N-acetylmuramate dehydrogenase [Clostridia bacterium]
MSENIRLKKIEQELSHIEGLELSRNVSAKILTTFKGGGDVQLMISPKNLTALTLAMRVLKAENISPLIIGKGANTIIDDRGISTPVLSLAAFSEIRKIGNLVVAGSGCSGVELMRFSKNNGLTGLEFLAGIPATVGGLVFMNAGAFGTEINDKVVECEVLNHDLVSKIKPEFSYRKGVFEGILLSATFNLDFSTPEEIEREIERNIAMRRKKQPTEPSCGSVFKAVDGVPAAVFIEETGLKGLRIGGAEISKKHCNFIVNVGNATASDFLKLVELIQTTVHYEFGAKLEPEFVVLKDDEKNLYEL